MSYAVLETVRDDLGVIVRHVWHERMSGRLMTEREAHELQVMYTVQANSGSSTGRSSYHVCPWIDATTYHEGSTR